jgi:acetolactate synthase-1/2/3 large subunit
MNGTTQRIPLGQAILACIAQNEIAHVFCVPGESYLGLLDAFNDRPDVTLVSARHEEGAGLMAEAYAKVTGRPGVVLTTRGPGVTHLAIALHTAHQDSTPMVAIVGQVPQDARGTEAFQEMELADVFRSMCKWTVELQSSRTAVALVQKAITIATTGRPGPVLISAPENLFSELVDGTLARPARIGTTRAGGSALEDAAAAISAAPTVAVIAGAELRHAGAAARQSLEAIVERLGAPVYTGWRQFDAFPNTHPNYLGPLPYIPALLTEPIAGAELVLAVGARLSDKTTMEGRVPHQGQALVQLAGSVELISGAGLGGIGVAGDLGGMLEFLLEAIPKREPDPQLAQWRARYLRGSTPVHGDPDGLDHASLYSILRRVLPSDVVSVSDAGAFSGWLGRFGVWTEPTTFVAPQAGGMGYAVPGAIGAKLAHPDRAVVAYAGDGGFAMTMSEVQTAVRLGLGAMVFLVFNNQAYGTIMLALDDEMPGRRIGVDLGDLDFATVAAGLGARGIRVTSNAEFEKAVVEGLSARVPTVIDIRFPAGSAPRAWSGWTDGA